MRIYGFKGTAELVYGWQAHARKQQLIHEQSARRIQHRHYRIGAAAVVFASLAGSSAVAAWQRLTPNSGPNSVLTIISAIIATLASVFAGVITFLDLGGRAEQHRKTAASYKQALRTLEAFSIENLKLEWVRNIQASLADIDASAPIPPRKIAEGIERKPVKLCSTVFCAEEDSPASSAADPEPSTSNDPPSNDPPANNDVGVLMARIINAVRRHRHHRQEPPP